jgi:hypothetical protein
MNPTQPTSQLPARLSANTWTSRCIARIRAMDWTVSVVEADALARALWDSPGCRSEPPETSAERLFALHADARPA